jgi:hypothetical protein
MIEKEYVDFHLCMQELQDYTAKVKGTIFAADEEGDVAKGIQPRLGWMVIPDDPNYDSNSEVWFNITIKNLRRSRSKHGPLYGC